MNPATVNNLVNNHISNNFVINNYSPFNHSFNPPLNNNNFTNQPLFGLSNIEKTIFDSLLSYSFFLYF